MSDTRLTAHGPSELTLPGVWVSMEATRLLSGDTPPRPLKEPVAKIGPRPVLFISSSSQGEDSLDRIYRAAAGSSAELWHIGDADHTRGLQVHPAAYTARVVGFLDRALGVR